MDKIQIQLISYLLVVAAKDFIGLANSQEGTLTIILGVPGNNCGSTLLSNNGSFTIE